MAIKLHRCPNIWAKAKGHPCWKVQKALDDQGIEYEVALGPWPRRKPRTTVREGTGQMLYPAIEFEQRDLLSRAVARRWSGRSAKAV